MTTGEVTHTYYDKTASHAPVLSIIIVWKVKYPLHLIVSCEFILLDNSTHQKVYEKHHCNQSKRTFQYERNLSYSITNLTFFTVRKNTVNGTQRRTLLSSWRMHHTKCGIPKGTSQAEVTLTSEKNQVHSHRR